MAYKSNNQAPTGEAKPRFDLSTLKDLRIENVRVINDTAIGFTLSCEGAKFRQLRIVNSAKGEFVAMPSEKAANGNYYPIYSIYLTDEDQRTIIDMVKATGGIDG